MNVSQQININASAGHLWHILAEDFDQISGWATAVWESGPNPQAPEGEGRVCLTTLGKNTETITHIDEQERTYTYVVVPEKPPFFLKGIENTWTVTPIGNERSEVRMSANVKMLPIVGQLFGPLVERRMQKGFVPLLEELKQYAETGEVHPRKQQQVSSRSV